MGQGFSNPKTLLEAVVYFSDEKRAFETVRDARWPNGVHCPLCGGDHVRFMEIARKATEKTRPHTDKVRRLWQCRGCRKQFTAKTGSIFEDSPLPFSLWLPALWLLVNCKNGISSYELARDLKIQQRSAWFLLHRGRLALQNGSFEKLADHVEIDETYIGGKARNMHKEVRARKISGTGGKDKTTVMGMIERGGTVITKVIQHPRKSTLHTIIKNNVLPGSFLYTDAFSSYNGLNNWYEHQVIDHAVSYVNGTVHTNSMENYWSLLKRTISGTYVSVEPFHLHRYLDEQSFRFNERRLSDGERFQIALSGVVGRRVTYARLTGKECQMRG
jgi:transposase-like protein